MRSSKSSFFRSLWFLLALAFFTAGAPLDMAGVRAAALSQADRSDIARVEKYLNTVKTMRARFFQVAPDGRLSEGGFWLRRPGRLRFEYDPPTPYLVIADGFWLVFFDQELDEPQRWPISDTPLGVLVAENVRFSETSGIETVERGPGKLEITLRDQKRPDDGTLTLVFSDRPLQLRQWHVVDGQGQMTSVTLDKIETGMPLKIDLFVPPDQTRLAPQSQ